MPPSTPLRLLVGALPAFTLMTAPFVDIPGRRPWFTLLDAVLLLVAFLLVLLCLSPHP